MAEKAFFYNALPDANSVTGYDRNYNADDLSDWLATVWETGVVKSDDGLKVVATSGMTVNVNAGKACILGKPYNNTSLKALTVGTAPTGSTARYDLVVLQYNNETHTRHTRLLIKQDSTITGLSTDEDIEKILNRSEKVFEICLAVIMVAPNATSISQSAIYDKRGNATLCPWFTAVKGYEDYYDAMVQSFEYTETLDSLKSTVQTNISSKLFNAKYSQIEVYTNGLKEPSTAYTYATNGSSIVITFTANRSAGAVVNVCLDNYIDGEGMSVALAQYSQWANAVATLQTAGEYNYLCNGVDDNVQISNIVKAYQSYGSGSVKLNVIGAIGMTAPARGDGSMSNPFGWFDFAQTSVKRVILDFTRCEQISPPVADGKYSFIFYAPNGNIQVIGANVTANNTATDTIIRLVEATNDVVLFDNCIFWVTGYKNSLIATRGTFKYCRGHVANVTENSYCFLPSGYGTVKIVGGEYYAYTGDSSKQSAIVGQSSADSVSILYGVSAPTSARSGFYQTHSLLQWTGGGFMRCTDLVSALPMTVVASIAEIRGTIALSKTKVL